MKKDEIILVTGACGQIGTELALMLRTQYKRVIASDIRKPEKLEHPEDFAVLDVLDKEAFRKVIKENGVTQIYHLAAILSAAGEKNPMLAWKINLEGGLIMLELAVSEKISKVFWPSSIAVFGPGTERVNTPQYSVTDPNTIYGITKLAGECWSAYYFKNYGLDVRSIRYPGLISYKANPGGGTTDYAVEIYHEALKHQSYTCFLNKDTRLPMMYMPDALRATYELMEAPKEQVKIRTAYNLTGMSFTPEEIAAAIKEHIPNFHISYEPDFREQIARSWPESIDDSRAQEDWDWKATYDLTSMTKDMLEQLAVEAV